MLLELRNQKDTQLSFYTFDSNEFHCVPLHLTGFMLGNGLTANFTSPACKRIQLVHLWVKIRDFGKAVRNHPNGNTVFETDVKLIYN